MAVSVSCRPLTTPSPSWTRSILNLTKTAPWSCSCSATTWLWVSLYNTWFKFGLNFQDKFSPCLYMSTKFSILSSFFFFAAVGDGCRRWGRDWGRRGGAASWGEELNFRKKQTNLNPLFFFLTSHQPKLYVWLCVHIHAQICMFTLHSVCKVQYVCRYIEALKCAH